jgi:hypothetical protein
MLEGTTYMEKKGKKKGHEKMLRIEKQTQNVPPHKPHIPHLFF